MAEPLPPAETILLVDDEPVIRALVRTVLRGQGYRVLEAESAAEAERVSAAWDGPLVLLISDLTLPRMNGPTLAARLARTRPAMKLLLLSGYPAEEAERVGLLRPEWPFLQKPFELTALVNKVREVLGKTA
jgi:DNA-binding response OmpR family regulator